PGQPRQHPGISRGFGVSPGPVNNFLSTLMDALLTVGLVNAVSDQAPTGQAFPSRQQEGIL
ncbi:MAG: hypothetical protein WCK00_04855, partial [Deltaproteobacteria bacterium]